MQLPLPLWVRQRTAQAEVQGQFAVYRAQRWRYRAHVGQEEEALHLHVSFESTLRHEYTLDTDFLPTAA